MSSGGQPMRRAYKTTRHSSQNHCTANIKLLHFFLQFSNIFCDNSKFQYFIIVISAMLGFPLCIYGFMNCLIKINQFFILFCLRSPSWSHIYHAPNQPTLWSGANCVKLTLLDQTMFILFQTWWQFWPWYSKWVNPRSLSYPIFPQSVAKSANTFMWNPAVRRTDKQGRKHYLLGGSNYAATWCLIWYVYLGY